MTPLLFFLRVGICQIDFVFINPLELLQKSNLPSRLLSFDFVPYPLAIIVLRRRGSTKILSFLVLIINIPENINPLCRTFYLIYFYRR